MTQTSTSRRYPVGAELVEQGVHFRVWAPLRTSVEVVLEGSRTVTRSFPLEAEDDGYFSGIVEEAGAGTLYRFRLDGEDTTYPDPMSRFQPEGPHGPSEVIDPDAFRWTDVGWKGITLEGQVVYELHVGTYTQTGNWDGLIERLPDLAELGITVIEVMPVADFAGEYGWGYDGVNMFAPSRLYGRPDDFRRFVDRAHALGLAVILDVVYNHFGPSGNYLGQFSDRYVTHEKGNEWGDAINFDGDDSGPVREFFIANAAYWIDEYRLDGLRLDATQQIFDDSDLHILLEIGEAARQAADRRGIILVAENEEQTARLARPIQQGGLGMDGLWNDDWHHTVRVALTGKREAYYSDYFGTPGELTAAAKYGYLFQGQHYIWQKQPRGTSSRGLPRHAFVNYLENHDQVANSATGARLHQLTSPGRHRAMTAFLLLGPWTPLLFQGQEFNATAPFLFFADHEPDLATAVRQGRAKFMSQFPSLGTPEGRNRLHDPGTRGTFELCRIDHTERQANAAVWALHADLIRLRRDDPVFSVGSDVVLESAVLTDQAFLLRLFAPGGMERLVLVNLGRDLRLAPAPQPLLAPPEGHTWSTLWHSDAWIYGGNEQPVGETSGGWMIPAESTTVLAPLPALTPGRRDDEENRRSEP